jgi:hypothetical protein
MQDPRFKDRLFCRWHSFRKGLLSTSSIHGFIDEQAALLAESQARNYAQFPILDQYIYPNTPGQVSSSYQSTVNDLKNWITIRTDWMDKNMPGFCNSVDITANAADPDMMNAFPNPFADQFTLYYNSENNAPVQIELSDITGRKVMNLNEQPDGTGEHSKTINTATLTAGAYFLRVNTGERTFCRKIIKTTVSQ